MRSRYSFYFSILLLPSVAGCTGLFPVSGEASRAGASDGQVQVQKAGAHASVKQRQAVEPPSELTPDLVYTVLVGQVARQRGEHKEAFIHFLRGARLAQDTGLAELAASSALALDDPVAIQKAADAWLDLAPDSIGAHQLAAYARVEADDIPSAIKHLRRIIALAAKEGEDGYGQAAHLVSKLKPLDRRMKLMETLTSDEPKSADAWFASALVAAGANRYEKAVDAARRAAELRPGWNQPRIFLVQLLLNHGDRAQARKTLEAFVSKSPNDQGLRLLYAQLLVDEQEFSRARSVFEHMLRNMPKEPDVLFALGVLSLQLEDLKAAGAYFEQLRDTGERQGDAAFYLGQVADLKEDPMGALSWYRKVKGEHALDAQIRIAQIRAEQGDVERAREILHQLRDQWPEDAPTLFLIEAAILSSKDSSSAAMDVYDEAVKAFPGNTELLYARGLNAVTLNRLDVMEKDFKAILDKDADNADALNALGYSLADKTGRFKEAQYYIERALALKPDDPAVLDSMGWVQFRLGKPEKALDYLKRALAAMPDGEVAAHLGEVLWSLGQRDQAWSIWGKALSDDPDHAYLLRVMGRHKSSRSDPQP